MTHDPSAIDAAPRDLRPARTASPCAEARERLDLAREGFREGDFTRVCWQSRLAALYASRLPAIVSLEARAEADQIVQECRALDAAARACAPERVATWEAKWEPEMDHSVAAHLLDLQAALQRFRDAKLEGLKSVAERKRRRRAAWLLGRGLRELVDGHAIAAERFFSPQHEEARAALRSTLEARERQTKDEDDAWRAKPSWESPNAEGPAGQRPPVALPTLERPLYDGPLSAHEADPEYCLLHLSLVVEHLGNIGDDAMRGFDLYDRARYRTHQLRSFPETTEAQLQRAAAVMRIFVSWRARRDVSARPTIDEWRALRQRNYAAQIEAQIETLERLAAELPSLTKAKACERRTVMERALSRKESSIGAGTMPPFLFETERYVEAQAALQRAWAERMSSRS